MMIALFDLDGTLLNTLGDLHASVNHVMREHHYPEHSLDAIRRFVGNGVALLIQRACPEGTAEEEIARCLAEFRSWYREHSMERTEPYEGIPELLAYLKNHGVVVGTVSNKFEAAVKDLCDVKLPGLVEICVGDLEGYPRKPDPANVRRAIEMAHQLHPSVQDSEDVILYIGDSETDVQTAKNAKLPMIGVTWGFRDRSVLVDAGAKILADNACELQQIMEEFMTDNRI